MATARTRTIKGARYQHSELKLSVYKRLTKRIRSRRQHVSRQLTAIGRLQRHKRLETSPERNIWHTSRSKVTVTRN